MARDKIKAAARRRMAQTGESYAAARREVIRSPAARSSDPAGDRYWFAISYDDMGPISTWTDTCSAGARPEGRSRSTPASSGSGWPTSRSTCRALPSAGPPSALQTRETIGVHAKGGSWLANSFASST